MMEDSKRKQLSTSGLFDLWEHACLLYHNFEWQSAADTFSHLAKVSSDPTDQRTFALNTGLIEARLGDFDLASMSFGKALLLDKDDPIAHFLLGVVSVELQDHSTGYVHLKNTLKNLHDDVLDCRTRGLDFGLARSAVAEDAERVQAILKAEGGRVGRAKVVPICLHNIPAELIFEAPPRSGSTSQEERTSSSGHILSAASKNDINLNHDPKISTRRRTSHTTTTTTTSTPRTTDNGTIEIGFDLQLPIAPLARSLPPKRLSPRNAQIREGSTKELARFLRHAGPSGSTDIAVDRLYLQGLMQGYNSSLTTTHGSDQTHDSFDAVRSAVSSPPPHDDLESLLDLYIGYRPEGRTSPDGARISGKTHVSRKPLPGAAVSPILATNRTSNAALPRRRKIDNLEIPLMKRRRPTLETAQRWLRKELNAPWTRDAAKGGLKETDTTFSPGTPTSATSSNDRSKKPVPSTVSSTEIFRFGLSRKRRDSR